MEQHTIYKCYFSYKCWICAELCEAFIFLMENIYTYVQFEGMIYQQIVGILPCGHDSDYSFWSITFKLHM